MANEQAEAEADATMTNIDPSLKDEISAESEEGEPTEESVGYAADLSRQTTMVEGDDASSSATRQNAENVVPAGSFGIKVTAVPELQPKEIVAGPEETQDREEEQQQPFVNDGLAAWEKRRQEWLSKGREKSRPPARARNINVDEIIDCLFQSVNQVREQGGPRQFPQVVPLPQMVDILQDLWEAEGLDP
jgi:hypothetical protein